jgi:copper chaperone CopZ
MKMKRQLIAILLLTSLTGSTPAADKPGPTGNVTNQFLITGMHCDGCANGLTAELRETKGVTRAQVTFSNQLAVVVYHTNRINAAQLTKVIKAAGFTAKELKP